MSRPTKLDSDQRRARFLCLVAAGQNGEDAAREAGLSPWRALRIVTETDYLDVVRAIQLGAGPVVVALAADEELAA